MHHLTLDDMVIGHGGVLAMGSCPLMVLVGLTGVGKTTTLQHLASVNLTVLPNRRAITDLAVIGLMQRQLGLPVTPVTDRRERFRWTNAYRAGHPGGVAQALTQLGIRRCDTPLLFDGLRGLTEVQYAVAHFPQVRFIVFDAPDTVRLERLLNRGDAFDVISGQPPGDDLLAALRDIPTIETVFTDAQLVQLASLPGIAGLELFHKVQIIVEERRYYDSRAVADYLAEVLPPARCLRVDTARFGPDEVAAQIIKWL